MRRETLTLEDAKEQCQRYPFVLLRELSRVYLGKTERADIHWEEVTEARFFDGESELRIFETGDGLSAALIGDSETEDETTCIDQRSPLAHDGAFGTALTLRNYFDYDEDGQLFIAATRLKAWEA